MQWSWGLVRMARRLNCLTNRGRIGHDHNWHSDPNGHEGHALRHRVGSLVCLHMPARDRCCMMEARLPVFGPTLLCHHLMPGRNGFILIVPVFCFMYARLCV